LQTFIPHGPDFLASADSLDNSRLGKQRAENIQIIRALLQPGYGWSNHPAVQMWSGHEGLLFAYHQAIVNEWTGRGNVDNGTVATFAQTLMQYAPKQAANLYVPLWLENERVSESHKASLYRKAPEAYPQFADAVLTSCHPVPYTRVDGKGRKVKTKQCDYFWPTHGN